MKSEPELRGGAAKPDLVVFRKGTGMPNGMRFR